MQTSISARSASSDLASKLLWSVGMTAVLAALAWANLRVTDAVVLARYNEGDFLEYSAGPTRGWPFSLAHFDQAAGHWVFHPIRFAADLACAVALLAGAFQVLRIIGRSPVPA